LIPPMQNGTLRWNSKAQHLEWCPKNGCKMSYGKDAVFLPTRAPFYATLSLIAKCGSPANSPTEITVDFGSKEKMNDAYSFLKSILPVTALQDGRVPKSRGLYQTARIANSRTPMMPVQKAVTPPSNVSINDSARRSFDSRGWKRVENASPLLSKKPRAVVSTEEFIKSPSFITADQVDKSSSFRSDGKASVILREFKSGFIDESNSSCNESQESEAVDRNKCGVERRRAAVETSKNIPKDCMEASFERQTTMTAESSRVLECEEHWSDCFYGDGSQIERSQLDRKKQHGRVRKSRPSLRSILATVEREESVKGVAQPTTSAVCCSPQPSTGFRRRISDVNETHLCCLSPTKSPIKKSTSVAPFSPKKDEHFNLSGFANLGATCYMNAVLQAIFSVETFSKELFAAWEKYKTNAVDKDSSKEGVELLGALSTLASRRLSASCEENKRLLRSVMDAIRSGTFSENLQQDAQEFMVHIFEQLCDECDNVFPKKFGLGENGKEIVNPVLSNFMFTLKHDIKCERCSKTYTTYEESTSLPIDFGQPTFKSLYLERKTFTSIQTMLDYCLRSEKVEHRCDECGSDSAVITHKFRKMPRCLVMYLKRYTFDADSYHQKRADSVDIPLFVTLDGHCAKHVEAFTRVSSAIKNLDFCSTNPSISKHRSPEEELQCTEKFAMTTPGVYPNPQCNSGALGELANGDAADSFLHHHRRKSGALPRRLWPASSDSMSPLRAKDLGKPPLRGDDAKVLQMSPSPLKRSGSLKDDDACSADSDWASEASVLRNGEHTVNDDIFSSPAEKKGRIENSMNNTSDLFDKSGGVVDAGTRPSVSSTPSSSIRRGPFTSEELAQMSESEQVEVAIEWSVSGEGASEGINREEMVAVDSSRAEIHESSRSSALESEIKRDGELGESDDHADKASKKGSEENKKSERSLSGRDVEETPSVSEENASIVETSFFPAKVENGGTFAVRYNPVTQQWRAKACSFLGLDLVEQTLRNEDEPGEMEMSVYDCPKRVASVAGDGNCLFRALAYAITGGSDKRHALLREKVVSFEMTHEDRFRELKGLDVESWREYVNDLLNDCTWGSGVEISACASMLNIDIWTFLNGQWLCYRPRFRRSKDGVLEDLPQRDYKFGKRKGIYLLNEHCHFSPVIEPSNVQLLAQQAYDERIHAIIANAEVGEMEPSYRLVSIVSHRGLKSNSGHYVCDVWNRKEHRWLHCDDNSISAVSEEAVRTGRTECGYLFFYVAKSLLEENDTNVNK
uniref:USP domain-containing protein n=1 Tax=Parascaris univalens TaxID=6257 RepID=A0A915AM33_PARUN